MNVAVLRKKCACTHKDMLCSVLCDNVPGSGIAVTVIFLS